MRMEKVGSSGELHVKSLDPVMVPPCVPLPRAFLQLSPLDKSPAARRAIINSLLVYNASPTMASADPAIIIRESLSKALVYYFPLAGRLRNKENGDIEVECTGEGALFVEAMADDSLSVLGDLDEPNPSFLQLFFSHPMDTPVEAFHLLTVQVTRFTCGGFVVGVTFHHSVCDGGGAGQFLKGLAEIAKGEGKPSLEPIWGRELLDYMHSPENPLEENGENMGSPLPSPLLEVVQTSLVIKSESIKCIKQCIMEECKELCSTFEVLAALAWRARTKAFQISHTQNVTVFFPVDMRKLFNPPLPKGYYGNGGGSASAVDNVQDLLNGSLWHVIKIIKNAKASLIEGILSSGTVMKPPTSTLELLTNPDNMVGFTDWRHLGFNKVDFGWGDPVNVSPIHLVENGLENSNFFIFMQSKKIEDVKILMWMPPSKVKSFKIEMEDMINKYAINS